MMPFKGSYEAMLVNDPTKIIYKQNILCHIFHESYKSSQRSEDSCVVTPGSGNYLAHGFF